MRSHTPHELAKVELRIRYLQITVPMASVETPSSRANGESGLKRTFCFSFTKFTAQFWCQLI